MISRITITITITIIIIISVIYGIINILISSISIIITFLIIVFITIIQLYQPGRHNIVHCLNKMLVHTYLIL